MIAPQHQPNIASSETVLNLTDRDRILVLGGYGVRNVGDEAILAGLITELPSGAKVRVISRNPAETHAMHGVEAVSPTGALNALARSTALIVGGGGLFSSDTGPFGRYIPLFARLALAKGTRVYFHGVGVYPSTPAPLMASIVSIAPRLESFTVRDTVSLQTLRGAGVDASLIPDLSESMASGPEDTAWNLLRSAGVIGGVPIVGLCLTALNDDLNQFLLSAVPRLVEARPDLQFLFVPISQHPTIPRHNDLNLARAFASGSPRISLLEGVHHPARILALFTQFSAAVCMRYHSYLFAERAGVPIVPVPYAEKCYGWLDERDLPPTELSAEGLINALDLALSKASPTLKLAIQV